MSLINKSGIEVKREAKPPTSLNETDETMIGGPIRGDEPQLTNGKKVIKK